MKIILLQDIPHFGKKGEVKETRDGYARNFLLPRGLATPATEKAVGEFSRRVIEEGKRVEERVDKYKHLVESISRKPLEIRVKVGEKGKLFGALHAAKISDALAKIGIAVEKDWIVLSKPIKEIGEHIVEVKFPHGVRGELRIIVTAEI